MKLESKYRAIDLALNRPTITRHILNLFLVGPSQCLVSPPIASHLLSYLRVANTPYPAAIPTESDTESIADGQSTPKAEPSARAKSELADTVMKDAKTQNEEPNEEEEEETGDEETYEPEKILSHRADFDEVSCPLPFLLFAHI